MKTSRFQQGSVVVIEFPFSNLAEKKIRPAVVLSNKSYNAHRNILLAGIYGSATPCAIPITNNNLVKKKLVKNSYISLQNIFSAEKTLVARSIDALTKGTLGQVLAATRNYL